jgi:hypothetical protein
VPRALRHPVCKQGAYGVMPRMPVRFRHAAIVGKYQARGIRPVLEELAHFLVGLGLEVSFDARPRRPPA